MPLSHIALTDAGLVIDELNISERSLPMTIEYNGRKYRLAENSSGTLTLSIIVDTHES